MILCDAHCHYDDDRLAPFRDEAIALARKKGLSRAVVNGSREEDWQSAADFCREHPWALPAFGMHPWRLQGRTPEWEAKLRAALERHPGASVGETGLDSQVENADLADQTAVFKRQLALAAELNRPITIHCVRAWEPLKQILQRQPAPARGFLMHAWTAPAALIPFFVEKGAYFSFSPAFANPNRGARRRAFREMPRDRILLETDAPSLGPPPAQNPHPLRDPATGAPVNHPANLTVSLFTLAETLELSPEETAALTTENWRRLFEG